GGPDMRMREIEEAATLVQEQAHEDANIIFGATVDETMGDAIKVTVIATGFEQQVAEVPGQLASVSSTRPALAQAPAAVAPRPEPYSRSAFGRDAPGAPPLPVQSTRMPPTQRQPLRLDEPAFPTRRAPVQSAAATAPAPAPSSSSRTRETFVPPLDSEW